MAIYPIGSPGRPSSPGNGQRSPSPSRKTTSGGRRLVSFSGFVIPAVLVAVAVLSLLGIMTGMRYVTMTQSFQMSRLFKEEMILPVNSPSKDGRRVEAGEDEEGGALPEDPLPDDDSGSDEGQEEGGDEEGDEVEENIKPSNEGSDEEEGGGAENDSDSGQEDDISHEVGGDGAPLESGSNEEQADEDNGDESDGQPESNGEEIDGASEAGDDDAHLGSDDRQQSAKDDSDGVAEAEAPSTGDSSARERIFFNPKRGSDEDVPHSPSVSYPRIASISISGEDGDSSYNLRGSSKPEDERRTIEVSSRERRQQKRLLDSDDFSYRDPLYEGECVPMQPWQETSFPNCNLMHELDFGGKALTQEFEFVTKGGYNQIFWLEEKDKKDDPELAMKILKYGTEYSDRNYDRVRRDGLILERLTKSPYVLDTYGFCGFDVLTPYADGGTLSRKIGKWHSGKIELTRRKRLQLAVEVASGLADVHDIDGEGLSAVAHGDLKGAQYLFLDGEMKLGDFNRGRFLRRNSTAPHTACPYTIGVNDAAFRSPEEYEYLPQTSAIDVYALGSLLYEILTGVEVWYDTDTDKAQKLIRKGKHPRLTEEHMESTDPVDAALRDAMAMCYVFDPKLRPKAGDVAAYLRKKLSELPKDYE